MDFDLVSDGPRQPKFSAGLWSKLSTVPLPPCVSTKAPFGLVQCTICLRLRGENGPVLIPKLKSKFLKLLHTSALNSMNSERVECGGMSSMQETVMKYNFVKKL